MDGQVRQVQARGEGGEIRTQRGDAAIGGDIVGDGGGADEEGAGIGLGGAQQAFRCGQAVLRRNVLSAIIGAKGKNQAALDGGDAIKPGLRFGRQRWLICAVVLPRTPRL